jgi:hypothetical protein
MFAECSVVMLAANALLFFTPILNLKSTHRLLGIGLLLAMAGLALLWIQPTHGWMMYHGVGLTAAGASRAELAGAMGGLAAVASLGQTLGSAAGGWLFGASPQHRFGWLLLPLILLFLLLLVGRASLKSMTTFYRNQPYEVTS